MKIIFFICIFAATNVQAQSFMETYEPKYPPEGYVNFCKNNNELCFPQGAIVRIKTNIENLIELDEVNRFVNSKIKPVSDLENYGIDEFWTIPINKGDCEDFALLKQKILIFQGWPSSSLLLTVVKDENHEGHLVLTVRTTQGDYILDNKIKNVLLWNEVPYSYIMRQSTTDPMLWFSLESRKN